MEAVERALVILEAFANGRPRLTLAELARHSGFYPSTILRLAASLARFGYMLRDADGAFRLGPTPLRLGGLYQDAFDLAAQVRPVLARLVERTGETAAFYIRECEQRICLYRHHAPRPIRQHLEEGAALPLDRGAGGRILTAFGGGTSALDASTRTRGFYLSVGERDPETAAIAAPVFTARGLAGALGVTGPRGRIDGDAGPPLTTAVLEEARRLTRVLGGG